MFLLYKTFIFTIFATTFILAEFESVRKNRHTYKARILEMNSTKTFSSGYERSGRKLIEY